MAYMLPAIIADRIQYSATPKTGGNDYESGIVDFLGSFAVPIRCRLCQRRRTRATRIFLAAQCVCVGVAVLPPRPLVSPRSYLVPVPAVRVQLWVGCVGTTPLPLCLSVSAAPAGIRAAANVARRPVHLLPSRPARMLILRGRLATSPRLSSDNPRGFLFVKTCNQEPITIN